MKNIIYMSQLKDSCGYAVAARSYLKSLHKYITENNKDYNLKVHSVKVEMINPLSREEEEFIDSLSFQNEQELDEMIENEEFIVLWHMPPPMIMLKEVWHEKDTSWRMLKKIIDNSKRNISVTVWEADKIPDTWFGIYNHLETRDVIVPCEWNKDTFDTNIIENNEKITVSKVPHVIQEDTRKSVPIVDIAPKLENKFVLFTMSQWNQRKGFDKLIQAFTMEFSHNDDVVLVIKTYDNLMPSYVEQVPLDQQAKNIFNQVQNIRQSVITKKDSIEEHYGPRVNNVFLLPWLLPYENINWLYEKSDVFCLATRGEGFGLTISEAIMNEKPVIVPSKGGHTDYISEYNNNLLFDCYKSPYFGMEGYTCDMNWYEPNLISLRKKLRLSYEMWKDNKLSSIGKKNKQYIIDSGEYTEHSVGKKILETIESTKESKFKSYRDVVLSLQNKHKGQDCIILTCGPSLSKYTQEELKEITKDKVVFAIKQAYEKVPNIVDYHFFNSNNVQLYEYEEGSKPFVIVNSADTEAYAKRFIWTTKQKYDIYLNTPNDRDYNLALCNSYDFDKHTLDKTNDRPWGPGMMSEVVLYFCLHMGFNNVYTIGWDLESPGDIKSNHFYDDSRELVRKADPMEKDEIEKNIQMSKKLFKWLAGNGLNLYISSPDSYVHADVPRKFLLNGEK